MLPALAFEIGPALPARTGGNGTPVFAFAHNRAAVYACGPVLKVHTPSSRTRAEARVVYRDADEDVEEIATSTRRFSLLDITSGLPDDSREAEEHEAERRLRDLRGRVKRARAVIARTPRLAETLRSDWQRAVEFSARYGVREEHVRHGVPSLDAEVRDFAERVGSQSDWMAEVREWEEAAFP